MFYLMELQVLWNGFLASLIMLRVFGKELSDSINHGFDKYSDDIENMRNKFSDNMHNLDRKIVHKKFSNNIKAIGINFSLLNCMGDMFMGYVDRMGAWIEWVACVYKILVWVKNILAWVQNLAWVLILFGPE